MNALHPTAFYVSIAGQEATGPYGLAELEEMLTSGQLAPDALFAYDGASQWLPLTQLNSAMQPPATCADTQSGNEDEALLTLLKDWITEGTDCWTRQPDGLGSNAHEIAAEELDEVLSRSPWNARYREICYTQNDLSVLMNALAIKYPAQFKSVTLTEGWRHPVQGWIFSVEGALSDPPPANNGTRILWELLETFSELDDAIESVEDEGDPWYDSSIATFAAGRFFEVLNLNGKAGRKTASLESIDFDAAMEELASEHPDRVRLHRVTSRGTKIWAFRCEE